jgi:xeroderma pigmentosum group C-complementing protein
MLDEARAEMPIRPLKRKRPGEGRHAQRETPAKSTKLDELFGDSASSDETLEFKDVALPAPTVQTIVRESDDDDDDEDGVDFEDVAIESVPTSAAAGAVQDSKELNLDLSAHMAAAAASRRVDRRKAISREEKARRVEIHKMHLACLLAHAELRNRWCNDRKVQDVLRPLLPQKTVAALIPRASLNQFSRTESLRKGLQEAKELWKLKYAVTERGLRRALWAEDEEQLKNVRCCHGYPV